jgi:hypothetical protein
LAPPQFVTNGATDSFDTAHIFEAIPNDGDDQGKKQKLAEADAEHVLV